MALKPITITTATTLTRNVHANTPIVLNSTTGRIVTLPAATGTGDSYYLFIRATVASGSHVFQVANSTDVLQGAIHLTTDIAGTSMPTTTTTDTVTMNGTTTGGIVGSWLRATDVATGFFQLEGGLVCSGTEATPFSAAV